MAAANIPAVQSGLLGQYRTTTAAGANTTVIASAANGTPTVLLGFMPLAIGANLTVAGDVKVYDGAIGVANVVFTSNTTSLVPGVYYPINAPLVNGCLTINSQANAPASWLSWMGTGAGGV